MKKKLLTLTFMVTSSLVFLPVPGISATMADPSAAAKTSPPQITVQIGRNRRNPNSRWWRGRHRGWYQGRRVGYYRNNRYYVPMRGSRTVRQVYWVNGRRYTRYVNY